MIDAADENTVMVWRGKRVDEMSIDELRETVRQMGDYIETLKEQCNFEAERTLQWMRYVVGGQPDVKG